MSQESDLRRWFATTLLASGVYTLMERGIEEQFVSGAADIPLDQLEMDSLALMQFCIEMEKAWGVSIAPDELAGFGTLQQLAASVESRHAD